MTAYSHNENCLTPAMTSNSTPSPVVISSSPVYTGAYLAFIHSTGGGVTVDGVMPWLKVFSGGPFWAVSSYTYTCDTSEDAPSTWYLEGSTDDTNWDVLDYRSGVVWDDYYEMKTFVVTSPGIYNYHRLRFGDSELEVSGIVLVLELIGTIATPGTYELSISEALELTDTALEYVISSMIEVSDTFYILDTVAYELTVLVQEALGLTDSAAAMLGVMIHDYLVAVEALTVNQSGTKTISEALSLADAAYPALHLSVADAVDIADTITVQLCIEILEHLRFSELVAAIGTLNRSVSDGITATDSAQLGFSQAVSSALSIVDVASVVGALVNFITESLVAADTASGALNKSIPVTDSLSLTDTVSSQGILYNVIYDTLHLGVTVELDGEVWECYVLNTPKFLPSIYSGFNFNSYCVFENRAYGCKADGIYELTGDTDNGVAFHTGVQFSDTTFGIPNQKRFRKAYVGVSGASPMMVMETEAGLRKAYTIDSDGEVDASRALRSKKWKLSVTDFDSLDFVKLYPVVLSK